MSTERQVRYDDGSWSRETEPQEEETVSTDDLTRRARAAARGLKPTVPGTSALVSELADEVDRLRAYIATQPHPSDLAQVEGERDAARAALGRVRGLAESAELAAPYGKPPYWTGHILNALEGES
jgi:hypothetical protein